MHKVKCTYDYVFIYSGKTTTWFSHEEVYEIVQCDKVTYFYIDDANCFLHIIIFGHDTSFFAIQNTPNGLKCTKCVPFWSPSGEIKYVVNCILTIDNLKWLLPPEKYERVICEIFKLI